MGSVASEEVIVQLLKTKCLPVLHYSLEACPLNKSDLKSLDYVLFSSFSKIFHTKSKDVIDECLSLFGCPPVITVVNKHKVKFLADYVTACYYMHNNMHACCSLVLHKRNLMHCRVTA